MARIASNTLNVRALSSGRFLVFGRVLGVKVRRRFQSNAEALAFKGDQELRVLAQRGALAGAPQLRLTRLTNEQLRDHEAAQELGPERRMVEWVMYGKQVAPAVAKVECAVALNAWLDALKSRKRSDRTADKNKRRAEAFISYAKVAHVSDITPDMIERYVFRSGAADYTRLTDAQVIRAWLNFCCGRARRWLAITPFEIDMKDLTATARPVEAGRILSPSQCAALLKAARTVANGRMLPYCILTTWCFLRDSEAKRTTRESMKLDGALPIIVVDPTKRRTVRYRNVTVPANVLPLLREAVKDWKSSDVVPFSRYQWDRVREAAGLLTRAKTSRWKRRKHLESLWQPDITRHTGISYLYQKCGDIREVCRQAGNKTDVSFRHYLTLPAEGAADKFYAVA